MTDLVERVAKAIEGQGVGQECFMADSEEKGFIRASAAITETLEAMQEYVSKTYGRVEFMQCDVVGDFAKANNITLKGE